MKKIFMLISGLLLASLAQGAVFYVASTGSDVMGAGTRDLPLRTIQSAIDLSSNGDEVIVLPGFYSGDGNKDLSFDGRTITVRSENPTDPACRAATVIDAKGQGLVARFTQDEGSGSVLEGFTLKAGDRSIPIAKGIPGFYEFSSEAKPTIRYICVGRGGEDSSASRRPMLRWLRICSMV